MPESGGDGPRQSRRDRSSAGDSELDSGLDKVVEIWARSLHDGGTKVLSSQVGVGSTVGDFRLIRELGAGGMGVVYEAVQGSAPDRLVAVKLIKQRFATRRDVARFEREIDAVRRLEHAAIVPIIATGVESGLPYYAMESIDGLSLSRIIYELRWNGPPPGAAEAVRRIIFDERARGRRAPHPGLSSDAASEWEGSYAHWVARLGVEVADALEHAHRRGIVHRDVTPGNILIDTRGRPMLVDFGLARGDDQERLTRTGDFVGTIAYASPEQLEGGTADERTDVRALGAVLYEALGFRLAFDAPDDARLRSCILREEASSLGRAIPREMDTICRKALRKDPRSRYTSALAMREDLRAFLEGRPIRARPPGPVVWVLGAVRRHRRIVASAVILLVLATALLAYEVWARRGDLSEAERLLADANQAGLQARRAHRDMAGLLRRLDRSGGWLFGEPALRYGDLSDERERHLEVADEKRHEARRAFQRAESHWSTRSVARFELARIFADQLRDALLVLEDVLDPTRLRRRERDLRSVDDRGEFRHLLDSSGRICIESSAPDSRVRLVPDPTRLEQSMRYFEYEGDLPLSLDDCPALDEGSYVAVISAPGHETIRLPLLVRREAVYSDGDGMPPREIRVDPPLEGSLPDGSVFIHEGWSLVGDRTLHWRWVNSFAIQRSETVLGAWIEVANDLLIEVDETKEPPFYGRPRWENDLNGLDVTLGLPMSAKSGVSERWPARGLRFWTVTSWIRFLHERAPRGWCIDLPTELEWERAGRGADGRLYPWGDEYTDGEVGRSEYGDDPTDVMSAENDVSPFLVHDMAGSVAEWTCSPFTDSRNALTVRGGSYKSGSDPEAYRISRRGTPFTEGSRDIGFRVIWRRPEVRGVPYVPTWPFCDDFEREDSEDVGNGWYEFRAPPDAIVSDPGETEQCSLRDGRLICEGGRSDGSNLAAVWQPIAPPDVGYRLEAVLSVSVSDFAVRGVDVGLVSADHGGHKESSGSIRLKLLPRTHDRLSVQLAVVERGRRHEEPMDDIPWHQAQTLRCVVDVLEDRIEARVGPSTSWGTASCTLTLDAPPPSVRFMTITASNYVGAHVEVEEVSVGPIDE